jgi:ADP-heptose:LPS heptosyltransferase
MSPASSHPLIAPTEVGSILVIRPRFVGDVCLSTPVLTNLRRLAPQAELHYATEEESAPLLVDDPRLTRLWVSSRKKSTLDQARFAGELRAQKFDVVLDLFCNPRTALWTAVTGARWRVGYPHKKFRSAAYNVAVRPTEKSAILFHLASLTALGWDARYELPEITLAEGELAAARDDLAARGVPRGAGMIGFHPGARWPTRRWGAEDFSALGRIFLTEHPDDWLLVFGGPGEDDLARGIARGVKNPRALAITGVGLRRFAALAKECRAFVAGDTGPTHVAVSVGTPTVGIFGRSEPERTFPYPVSAGHRSIYSGVWCSPCVLDVCDHMSCMRAISPDWVWDVLRKTLASTGSPA